MTQHAAIAAFHNAVLYPGFDSEDAAKPFAKYLQPEDASRAAGFATEYAAPRPSGSIETFADIAGALSKPGYLQTETGWSLLPGHVAAVAVYTPMPGVRARMWDWWFSWHGSDAARYKLWAPSAHRFACWKDGEAERPGEKSYIGRTSLIQEQIGSVFLQGAIRFVDPASIGFAPGAFDGTVICGRAGEVDAPVEHTWLIHQVRDTEDGCEMRSRFYLGQDPCSTGTNERLPPPDPARPKSGPVPAELLVHCATEMHHLAGFLPALHAEFAA